MRTFGIEVRAGLHTGEVELRGDDVTGLGVYIAARVMEAAGPGEVVASSTVKTSSPAPATASRIAAPTTSAVYPGAGASS